MPIAAYLVPISAARTHGPIANAGAGRAGRAQDPGRVIIQTHLTEHPLLQTLIQQGYRDFAQLLLRERQLALLPPYRYQILLRSDATSPDSGSRFYWQPVNCRTAMPELRAPVPRPTASATREAQPTLSVSATNQRASTLTTAPLLAHLIPQLETLPLARKVRWSIDIDPLDLS